MKRLSTRGILALAACVLVLVASAVAGVTTLVRSEGHPRAAGHRPFPVPASPPSATGTPAPPVLAPASAASRIVTRAAGGQRPNVVVVMLDDMRYDELRFAPNVAKFISSRGLLFENSFSPYPLCCPARTSFLKGQYPHNHGVLYIANPYAFGAIDDRVTIGSRLHDAGYQTALVGKYLNRYGVTRSKVTGHSSVHYVPRGWTDWMAALDPFWHTASGLHGGSVYHYFDFTQNINGTVTFNRGEYSSHVVGREVRGLISKYHRSKAPFFLFVTPPAPHNGAPDEPDDPRPTTMANGVPIRIGTPARPDWVKGRFDSEITHALGQPADGGPAEADVTDKPTDIRALPETTPEEQRDIRDLERQRAESIYAWDVQFGGIIQRLKQTGEYRNTVLMFTSDNGYYDGEHRMRQGKIWAHEPSLRVPFVVAGPGIRHGVRYTPITTADVTATILDLARAPRLPAMDSASRLARMTGPDAGWDVPVVTEGLIKDIPHVQKGFPKVLTTSGLRTGRYKVIHYASGEAELYDELADPLELTNVYDDPAYRTIRDQLDRLWVKYRLCKAAACQAPLPRSLRVGVRQLAHIDRSAAQRIEAYYGRPAG